MTTCEKSHSPPVVKAARTSPLQGNYNVLHACSGLVNDFANISSKIFSSILRLPAELD